MGTMKVLRYEPGNPNPYDRRGLSCIVGLEAIGRYLGAVVDPAGFAAAVNAAPPPGGIALHLDHVEDWSAEPGREHEVARTGEVYASIMELDRWIHLFGASALRWWSGLRG